MKKILIMGIVMVVSASAIAVQCGGTTKKGARCRRQATAGSAYCWQHSGGGASVAPEGSAKTGTSGEKKSFATTNFVDYSAEKTNLVVRSFLGVPVGADSKGIAGTAIKGKDNAKLVTIRAFRRFSKATVTYLPENGKIYSVKSDCTLSAKTAKEDVFKEAASIRDSIESKCGIKFKANGGGGYYSSVGGAIWSAPEWDYEYFEPGNLDMRITCTPTTVDNKGMQGPNIPSRLKAWKISLSFRLINTKQMDSSLFTKGHMIP